MAVVRIEDDRLGDPLMARTLFPILSAAPIEAVRASWPLYREILVDEYARPVLTDNGDFQEVTGAEAVACWARMALETGRYLWPIYSDGYGFEGHALIGRAYTDAVKTAEAPRMLREALLINPYITEVRDIVVSFSDTRLSIDATVDTIYGAQRIHLPEPVQEQPVTYLLILDQGSLDHSIMG